MASLLGEFEQKNRPLATKGISSHFRKGGVFEKTAHATQNFLMSFRCILNIHQFELPFVCKSALCGNLAVI